MFVCVKFYKICESDESSESLYKDKDWKKNRN